MAKKGKKYLEAAKLVDSSSLYSVVEAIELAKKTSTVNFDNCRSCIPFRS